MTSVLMGLKEGNMQKSMIEGNTLKLILNFSIPLLLGNLFQQFYNVVDAAIVGQTLGSKALAAVGASSSVQFLILGFCMGICQGFAIMASQSYGAKDSMKCKLISMQELYGQPLQLLWYPS